MLPPRLEDTRELDHCALPAYQVSGIVGSVRDSPISPIAYLVQDTDARLQQTSLSPNLQNVSDLTTPPALISSTRGQDGCGLRAASPNCSDPSEQLAWDVEHMELFRAHANRGELSG